MRECPKCGNRWIKGPRLVRNIETAHKERLRYECGCGYVKYEPTLEQEREENTAALGQGEGE